MEITAITRMAMMMRITIRVMALILLSSDNAVDYRISRIFARILY
jgi:hypothetical protein